jgi:hypothetical protein
MTCTDAELKQIYNWGIINKKAYKAWQEKREAMKLKA